MNSFINISMRKNNGFLHWATETNGVWFWFRSSRYLCSSIFNTFFTSRLQSLLELIIIIFLIWYGAVSEGGHALYEQGLLTENYGLPLGNSISLGIHESQSRLWENHVGRSIHYWKKNYDLLRSYFPDKLKNVDCKQFYNACNNVKATLIRTNSDELTYHLHVMIRYEIEKGLIEDSLKVDDLPNTWNKLYKQYLNIDVPSDSEGVLQDIHWSHEALGTFLPIH